MSQAWMSQKYTSANTSINKTKVPAIFHRIRWQPGTTNLDWGGGKYDTATEYLKRFQVKNVIYDPFNRSQEENAAALAGTYDTATLSNVLNVIAEPEIRKEAVLGALGHLKPGGALYISIYEGNHSGRGRESKPDCWQCSMPLKAYAQELAWLHPWITRGIIMIVKEE